MRVKPLLVGLGQRFWALPLGFAVAATAVRATWLGARVAGILAGVLGMAAGTALVVLSR